jgi:AraC-like DNA-binding protein
VPNWLTSQAAEMGFMRERSAWHLSFHRKMQDDELRESADKIIAECLTMSRGFNVAVELLVRQMLVHILRWWPREHMGQDSTTIAPQLPWLYMHRSTEYMNAYGKGEFRLSELCQQVGLSPSRFIPLFRSSACMSPHEYYNHLLVFKAQKLLRNEKCSTKEAAYELGFKNVSHFCSLYHKLTGATPKTRCDLQSETEESDPTLARD